MNLVVDNGNTRTKLALFSGKNIIEHTLLEEKKSCFLSSYLMQHPQIKNVIYSSVGGADEELKWVLKNQFPQMIVLSHETTLPIGVNYHSKETLGVDRLAVAVGAYSRNGEGNSLVIDAGTAITYEFVSSKGVYEGGGIAPGLNMRLKALNDYTEKLPLVEALEDIPEIGKNTKECIAMGVVRGMIFEIEGQIHYFKEKYSNLSVFFTGGDLKYFEKKINCSIFAVPFLAEEGLNRILIHYEGQD